MYLPLYGELNVVSCSPDFHHSSAVESGTLSPVARSHGNVDRVSGRAER